MKKIAVIHYMPLEFYPPVTNFLNSAAQSKNLEIKVWSTHNNKKREVYNNTSISLISRTLLPDFFDSKYKKIYRYLTFSIKCLLGLILYNPDKILYYESFSAGPVYWYLYFFKSRIKVLIHYHEYCSLQWYENVKGLVNYYHQLEKKMLYSKACWISQTNEDRIKLFLKDNPTLESAKMRSLANYPPLSWSKFFKINTSKTNILKTVYIGSLSLESTYIKEYCEWVITQNGNVFFDIYAFNLHDETITYLNDLNSEYIRFYQEGVEYDSIAKLLVNYDVGLILYKVLTDNYKFNAPNKLFEYLACGLQVWYSDKMLGIKLYESSQVLSVDFENVEMFSLFDSINNNSSIAKTNVFTAEEALKPLLKQLEA